MWALKHRLIVLLAVGLIPLGVSACDSQRTVEEQQTYNAIATESLDAKTDNLGNTLFSDHIPQYPGATELREVGAIQNGVHATFLTTDSEDTVFAYYKSILIQNGWQFLRESTYHPALTLHWRSEKPGAVNRDLHITFEVVQDGQIIHLLVRRWPNPNVLPQHPLAKDQHASYEWVTRGDYLRKIITYTTAVEPSQVSSFYESKMPISGWLVRETEEAQATSQTQTLDFIYRLGKNHKGKLQGGRALIELTAIGNSRTQVKIIVTGYGLSLPSDINE